MNRSSGQAALIVLAILALPAVGCMPRGPFPPASLFPDSGDAPCDGRDGSTCGRSGSREGHCRSRWHDHRPDGEPDDIGQPPLAAPISNFHPVPTRPVFTPWLADESQPEEVSGTLAWMKATQRPTVDKPSEWMPLEPAAAEPIVRRQTPKPAMLSDDATAAPLDDSHDGDSRNARSDSGWHSASPR